MADAEDNIYREAEVPGAPANGNVEGPAAHEVEGNIQEQVEEFLGPHPDYDEEEEERKYYRRKRLGVVKNVVGASVAGMIVYSVYLGLLQMQLILHYDETYREVKYGTLGLEDIDNKMLMGINVTPIIGLLYTPVLIRFLGTKWMMFLASGIYALFVSTNYWERYYTLVPSAVAIGAAIVPLWASLGNYITRMAQQYYEYTNYKEAHVQEQKKPPKGAFFPYIVIFQSVFYIIFHLCFVFAEFPMAFFLNTHLNEPRHILYNVKTCGANGHGIIPGLNKTVLHSLPRSLMLIEVESVLMGAAFVAMIIFLAVCGAAYRPTEEIDLRSIGWGNIFQLPFKHLRDYRLRLLIPFFFYSGFEVFFAINGIILSYGVCSVGLKKVWLLVLVYGLSSSACSALSLCLLRVPRHLTLLGGAVLHLGVMVGLMCWSPQPLNDTIKPHPTDPLPVLLVLIALWGLGTALNKTSLSILLGMLYEDKERLDFVFTIYHWCQAIAIFIVYLWSNLPMRAKLAILLVTLLVAMFCYWRMERQLAKKVPFRLPRIPRPRHKVKGYRYLEEENSDESDMEQSGDEEQQHDDDEEDRDTEEEEVREAGAGADGDAASLGSQHPPGPRGRHRRRDDTYEQAGAREEYAQPM
ncbi:protein unc-93 homolog B1 [Clupea harengus]|uniref:Protein unc-93 homolog B1 n=1 Tax=Clupea harengus TaxID=7950 RepID=A0A6P8ESV8_CLUHA|nr:protein unc-93 homolog B1 [Clupea harengus]XP_031415341.1 protein unc-93 homolog B1 [Clupea harengus]